jgi:histidyl-tRNA synthetase
MIFELIVPTPQGPVEVCGGGRYDGLARVLGSDRDDRGVGFAFGLERLLHVLRLRGSGEVDRERTGCLVLANQPDLIPEAISLIKTIRMKGFLAILDAERPRDQVIARADRRGLAYVLEADDESAGPKRTWTLYDLNARSLKKMALGEIWDLILSSEGGGER